MPDKLLRDFRAEAERLVPIPDLYAVQSKGRQRRRALVAASAIGLATVVAVSGVVASHALGQQTVVTPAQPIPASPSPLPTANLTSRWGYVARNAAICRDAHAKLNAQLVDEGYSLEVAPNDDGSAIEMFPTDVDGQRAYPHLAVPILREAVTELRSIAPPQSAEADFEKAYRALDLIIRSLDNEGYRPQLYFRSIHYLDGPQYGMDDCTLNLGR